MNTIKIDLERRLSPINRHIFGGFAEHLGRCIYGGIYDPHSPHADEHGLRTDVMEALRRLRMPILRYPGGNFVSGYRWLDGVGPLDERPVRSDMAWEAVDSNHFGTNEFVRFCRKINTEPYLVVNCGDGDMREARDWVEYCNGTQDTTLARLRRQHGFEAPHQVRYWGIGNEVDGHWQIGYKTPQEYARAYKEFAKVMRWADPTIKLIASVTSNWSEPFVERTQLLLEQAPDHIDYLSIHWYVGNPHNDFARYMTLSEFFEERIGVFEGLIRALSLQQKLTRTPVIAVDEWNVWYRARGETLAQRNNLEERYNLEDALVVAMHLNAFIRHARWVKMANIAQIVNVIAPIFTDPDGLFLQTIFFPFEVYARTCGTDALDVFWTGDTFSGGDYSAVRTLDVSATVDDAQRQLSVYVVNRSLSSALETTLRLDSGQFAGPVQAYVVSGPDIKAENTFARPDQVGTRQTAHTASQSHSFTWTFEPHSVTALVFAL